MRKSRSFKLGLAGLVPVALATASTAMAQTGEGTTKTLVISRGALINTADLDFGILAAAGGGTMTIAADTGAVTTSGGVTATGGAVSRARFTGSGDPGRVVTLSLSPSTSLTLTRIGGGATMTVNQIRVSVDGGRSRPLGPNHRLKSDGIVDITLGGRLNVGANQAQGVYTARFTLTMNYQ